MQISWSLSSGSVMIAQVKFSWCQGLEFSALADEAVVGSMRGRGDMGGTCCPGGVQCGTMDGSPQQTSRGPNSSLRFAPTKFP